VTVTPRQPVSDLDVPLAWGRDHAGSEPPAAAPAPPSASVRAWEVWVAYLADIGMILLWVGVAWILAAVAGAALTPVQIVLAAVVGVEAAAFAMTASLWAWRGSPGMLLANVVFSRPVALSSAVALCGSFYAVIPLLGLPLVVRRRGAMVAERLAGSPVSCREPRGGA
jgi:hypothetical protein